MYSTKMPPPSPPSLPPTPPKVDRKRIDYYETARKLQGMDGQPAAAAAAAAATVGGGGAVVDQGNADFSALARSGARESLTAAAGSMSTSFDQGFSGKEESSPAAPGTSSASSIPPAVAAAPAAAGDGRRVLEAREGPTAAVAPVASSSAGIADEDLRDVASMLVKRLSSGVPLTPGGFSGFSDAVDRIIESMSAEGGA